MSQINIRNRNKNKTDVKPNWEYRFETANIDGKRQTKSKCGFATKKEAFEAGTRALNEYLNTGKTFEPSNMSVSDFCDYWIENYAEPNLAYRTIKSYSHKLNKFVKPVIGHYYLKNVDTDCLQKLINSLSTNKTYKKVYILSVFKVVKLMFRYAKTKAKFIQSNPAEDLEMPRIIEEPEDYHILTKNEIETILERFKYVPYQYYAMLTGYYTGLRVSEVYALTWDCIDFNKKTITVNKSVQRIELKESYERRKTNPEARKTAWYFTPCKSEGSNRTIKIGDTLCDALIQWKMKQDNLREEYGGLYKDHFIEKDQTTTPSRTIYKITSVDHCVSKYINLPRTDLVFLKDNGSFDGTDSMKYVGKIARNELGIDFHFHALRHGHATALIENGAPIKDVQERLGHANTKITMDIYVSNTEKMKNESVSIFETAGRLNFKKPNIAV